MKIKTYDVVGVRKIISKEKQKTFTCLCCVSAKDEKSDFLCGRDVCQVFGKGNEMIGDTVKVVFIGGKSVLVDDED